MKENLGITKRVRLTTKEIESLIRNERVPEALSSTLMSTLPTALNKGASPQEKSRFVSNILNAYQDVFEYIRPGIIEELEKFITTEEFIKDLCNNDPDKRIDIQNSILLQIRYGYGEFKSMDTTTQQEVKEAAPKKQSPYFVVNEEENKYHISVNLRE